MYYAIWFDEDGELHLTEDEVLETLCNYLGGEEAAKALFRKQFDPEMRFGAVLIQGSELIWNFDAPPVDYQPEDFTSDEDVEKPE